MKLELLQVKEATGEKIDFPVTVATMMVAESKADRECLWVLHLNAANKVVEKELVSMGSATASIAHPREIFRKSIINSATSIITVHNHPAGGITPSKEDLKTWNRLKKAGEILGIPVIDNFIITPSGKYYSQSEVK
jgi:DNA repair protein RadC